MGHASEFLFNHTVAEPQASVFQKGKIQRGWCVLVLGLPRFMVHWNLGVDVMAQLHQLPSAGAGAKARADTLSPGHVETSVRAVLPLLVLLIFLLVGTFGTKPLHFLWRCSHYSNTGPVVPAVAVVTANHGASIVRFVTPRTDPDLIAPLVSDHVSADRLCHHAAHGSFGASCSGHGGGWRRHQSWACRGLGEEWQWHGGGVHVHRYRGWGWWWGFRSIQGRSRLSLGGWNNFADDNLVLASTNSESQPGDNWTWGWNDWFHFYLWKLVH